jgi:hypothetical protein
MGGNPSPLQAWHNGVVSDASEKKRVHPKRSPTLDMQFMLVQQAIRLGALRINLRIG